VTTLLALLKAMPQILSLITTIVGMVRDKEQRGLGRAEATADALAQAQQDIAYANAVEEDARRSHNQNPDTDAGFDLDFRRD
jgi:hypothetical protein